MEGSPGFSPFGWRAEPELPPPPQLNVLKANASTKHTMMNFFILPSKSIIAFSLSLTIIKPAYLEVHLGLEFEVLSVFVLSLECI